jgi:hypothetical protein
VIDESNDWLTPAHLVSQPGTFWGSQLTKLISWTESFRAAALGRGYAQQCLEGKKRKRHLVARLLGIRR